MSDLILSTPVTRVHYNIASGSIVWIYQYDPRYFSYDLNGLFPFEQETGRLSDADRVAHLNKGLEAGEDYAYINHDTLFRYSSPIRHDVKLGGARSPLRINEDGVLIWDPLPSGEPAASVWIRSSEEYLKSIIYIDRAIDPHNAIFRPTLQASLPETTAAVNEFSYDISSGVPQGSVVTVKTDKAPSLGIDIPEAADYLPVVNTITDFSIPIDFAEPGSYVIEIDAPWPYIDMPATNITITESTMAATAEHTVYDENGNPVISAGQSEVTLGHQLTQDRERHKVLMIEHINKVAEIIQNSFIRNHSQSIGNEWLRANVTNFLSLDDAARAAVVDGEYTWLDQFMARRNVTDRVAAATTAQTECDVITTKTQVLYHHMSIAFDAIDAATTVAEIKAVPFTVAGVQAAIVTALAD